MPKGVYERPSMCDQIFGQLTVKSFSHLDKHGKQNWKCLCKCGNVITAPTSHLKRGDYISCGCLKKHFAWKGYGDLSGQYWGNLRRNARTRDLEFNISKKDAWDLFLKQDRKCIYTGLILTFAHNLKSFSENQTASLDRIDSSKGYIKGNIQWVHKVIQQMKWLYTSQDFISWCHLVSKYNG